jgi:hypothetical protein
MLKSTESNASSETFSSNAFNQDIDTPHVAELKDIVEGASLSVLQDVCGSIRC